MRITLTLSRAEAKVLDSYVRMARLPSRSAAVIQAIRHLRNAELESAYEAVWSESGPTGEDWNLHSGDEADRTILGA